jgi:3-methylcrotonyl-CoA carboxylase beta subunit
MAILKPIAPTRGEQFDTNRKAMLDALAVVDEAVKAALDGGGQAARERHVSRGKILPRERVARLLDPGSPFLEVGATAAHGLYDDAPCAGVIAGVGRSRAAR